MKKLYGNALILQKLNEASSDEEREQIKAECFSKQLDSDYKKMTKNEIEELERLYELDQTFQ